MRSTDVQSATANRYNESDAGQTCVCFGAALEQRLDKLRKEEEEEKSSKRQRRIDDLKQDSGEEDEELTEMGLPQGFGTSKKKR
jgi:hypothetical protein